MKMALENATVDKIESFREDLVDTLSETDSSSSESALSSAPSRKSVTFHNIQIREYNMMLGDHPSVSAGAPITIEWDPVASHLISVDDYENGFQGDRRRGQELRLPASIRSNILKTSCSEEDMKRARTEVRKIQARRNMTRALEELDSLTALIQSARRKYRKWRRQRKGEALEPAEIWIREYKQNEDKGPFSSAKSHQSKSWHGENMKELEVLPTRPARRSFSVIEGSPGV